MPKTLDRRGFVCVAAFTGAGMLGLNAAVKAAAATGGGDAAVGTIVAVGAGGIELESDGSRVSVVPTDEAQMYSGAFGAVSDPDDFIVGDRVAVHGTRADSLIRADFVGSIYEQVQATVNHVSADGSVARTSIGDIELEDGRLPFTSAAHQAELRATRPLASGDTLSGLVWRHPAVGQTYFLVSE